MNKKEIRELKKKIWLRRHDKFPHLIEIDMVYNLLDHTLNEQRGSK